MRCGVRSTREPGKDDRIYLAEDNVAILFKLSLKRCGEFLAGFMGNDGQPIDVRLERARPRGLLGLKEISPSKIQPHELQSEHALPSTELLQAL